MRRVYARTTPMDVLNNIGNLDFFTVVLYDRGVAVLWMIRIICTICIIRYYVFEFPGRRAGSYGTE